LAGTLESEGWTVDHAVVRFDSSVPTEAELGEVDLVVVACPALGLSAPSHFLRWLDRWPRKLSGAAAVMGVCGAEWGKKGLIPGWSGALLGLVSDRLRHRGLTVVAAADQSYPVNWTQVLAPLDSDLAQRVTEEADSAVRAWALALATSLARPGVMPGVPRTRGAGRRVASLMSVLFRLIARRFLGKTFAADETCTGCGLCAKTCPSGVIRMHHNRPSWGLDCDACNRCINLCPSASIQVSLARVLIYGVGNLVLTVAALVLMGPWGWPAALGLYIGGTVLQLTVVDFLLGGLESVRGFTGPLTWGWSKAWGRYRAPGFKG